MVDFKQERKFKNHDNFIAILQFSADVQYLVWYLSKIGIDSASLNSLRVIFIQNVCRDF